MRFARWTSDLGLGFSLLLSPDRLRTVDTGVEQLPEFRLAERPRWVPFTVIRRFESLRVTF